MARPPSPGIVQKERVHQLLVAKLEGKIENRKAYLAASDAFRLAEIKQRCQLKAEQHGWENVSPKANKGGYQFIGIVIFERSIKSFGTGVQKTIADDMTISAMKILNFGMRSFQRVAAMHLFFFAFMVLTHGQQLVHGGALGGARYDYGRRVAHDGSDAAYVLGEFRDSADVDPGLGVFKVHAAKYQDIYLSKYDAQGGLQWAFALGDTFKTDSAKGLWVGPDGNVVMGGQFSGSLDANPGPGTDLLVGMADSIHWNSFFAKYSPTGQHLWAKRIGNPGQVSSIHQILVDDAGSILIVGSFKDQVDFDPGPGTTNLSTGGSEAGWIGKYDMNGNLLWVSAFRPGGINKSVARSLVPDNHGNYFVTGYFTGTVDFDPGIANFNLTSLASEDAFLLKLSSAGQLEWAYRIGGSGFQSGTSLAYNGAGGVYVGGDINGNADFDTGPWQFIQQSASVTGQTNGFVALYDSAGVNKWVGMLPSDTLSQVVSLRSDSARGVIVGGNFKGTIDIDPTTSSQFAYSDQLDMFVVRFGVTRQFSWGGKMGGPYNDRLCDMDYSPRGKVFDTGSIVATADLDFFTTSYLATADGGSDGFVSVNQVCQASLGAVYSATSCGYYYWLITGMVMNESGVYFKIHPNDLGCDSTLTLYLTIGDIDTTVTNNSGQLTANSAGGEYQWLDCDSQYAEIPLALGQSFTPTTIGTYAVMITLGSCIDTSACHTVSTLGISDDGESRFKVFPNPSTGRFRVLGDMEGIQLDVLDLYGRSVGVKIDEMVDLEGLPAGTYWIRLQGADGTRMLPALLIPSE